MVMIAMIIMIFVMNDNLSKSMMIKIIVVINDSDV